MRRKEQKLKFGAEWLGRYVEVHCADHCAKSRLFPKGRSTAVPLSAVDNSDQCLGTFHRSSIRVATFKVVSE